MKTLSKMSEATRTITDQSAAAQSMAKMLENISQSLSGMEFAFITSIAGLGGMIVLNGLFSYFTDVTHPLNNVLYSQDVAPRMGFVIPLTLQIMVVD